MTLNEVNIIKNSVLDATEAYVDARLSVADFAKTQIGVTEGEPTKVNKKYYHTVRCNAIRNVPDSGVVYRNVLSVGNTEFPAGSVVFLIAPNAQFSNQFILGKLDNTPINIVGGSIKIGGNDPDNNPVFSVNKDGVVRIKKGEITLGGTEIAPSFRVDNDGNIYIKKGEINLGQTTGQGGTVKYDVNINKDGFNLGYVSATNDYNFSVTDKGVMTMKKGSITLSNTFKVDDNGWMAIGGTDANANFYVANTGKVTIKSGSISLGYNNTVRDYNFKISDTGTLNLGVTGTTPSDKSYNFSITDAGKVTIKSGEINLNYNTDYRKYGFIVDNAGIKLGATSVGYNFTVDTNGNVNIKEGTITMKSGSITLANKFKVDETGWLAIGGINSNAPFYVANDGSVTIKSGQLRLGIARSNPLRYHVNLSTNGLYLGYLQESSSGNAQYNFGVNNSGAVTIRSGSINLGYDTTTEKYRFSVNNNGALTSTSGYIGGFEITQNRLGNPLNTRHSVGMQGGLNSSAHIYAWDSNYSVKIYPDKIKMDNAQINLEYGSSWCNVTVSNIQSNDKGYVVWHSELSDERYKNNIKEISSKKIKEFFNEIKPSSFKFNKNTKDKDNLIHYGVTAQNLEKALQQSKINSKSLVKFCKEKDMYFVDYQELHGFELAGIKNLYNIIENQQKQIDILKAQIKEVQNG